MRVRGLRFNIVSLLSLCVSYLTFVALSRGFPRIAPQATQLIGIVPATLINYFLNSYWTFRDPRTVGRSNVRHKRELRTKPETQ